MNTSLEIIEQLKTEELEASLRFYTFGNFKVITNGQEIENKDWGRDKTLQLLQFFISNKHRHALHKEQIIDRIWEDADADAGDRDFKVALHGIHKILEPDRKSRSQPKYIVRSGQSYQLALDCIWIDTYAFEKAITIANENISINPILAQLSFEYAVNLYKGMYLPQRVYMDWTSAERERLQILALGSYIALAKLIIDHNAFECVRLCQAALQIDEAWEEAYTLQIKAYIENGNRPQAIKTYNKCKQILEEEYGLEPLPVTKNLIKNLKT